jgi:hypothetical protein
MAEGKIVVPDKAREKIILHENILNSYKSQKARGMTLLNKYKVIVEEEAKQPSNSFMHWTRYVDPFIDHVINNQLINDQIIGEYQGYVKDLINNLQDASNSDDRNDTLNESFELTCQHLLELEKKYLMLRNQYGIAKKGIMETEEDYGEHDTEKGSVVDGAVEEELDDEYNEGINIPKKTPAESEEDDDDKAAKLLGIDPKVLRSVKGKQATGK